MNIQTNNLIKNYQLAKKTEVPVLKGISFTVKSGELVSIIGPSGAGKSTLLHLLGLMDTPTDGNVTLDDIDYSHKSETEKAVVRNKSIGFLFQMHYLLPEFTVLENLLLPCWENRTLVRDKISRLVEQFGVSHRLHHLPSEISGGEQQRVALIRALVNDPSILLCDEPTGNLDRETGENVEKLLIETAKERNITTIIVTHNAELAQKTDRIIKMKDGKISDL